MNNSINKSTENHEIAFDKNAESATKKIAEVILVDEHDNQLGTMEKIRAHREGKLHRAFSVFLVSIDPEGMPVTLLQQRCEEKYHCGGLWTNSCCSHQRAGESTIAAAQRRLEEELGIANKLDLKQVGSFVYHAEFSNGLTEYEFDHVVVARVPFDMAINPDPNEIMATKWVGLHELERHLTKNPEKFTPWFEAALQYTAQYWPKAC